MEDGCFEFSFTVEQLEQKKLKRKQAVSHSQIIYVQCRSLLTLFFLIERPFFFFAVFCGLGLFLFTSWLCLLFVVVLTYRIFTKLSAP